MLNSRKDGLDEATMASDDALQLWLVFFVASCCITTLMPQRKEGWERLTGSVRLASFLHRLARGLLLVCWGGMLVSVLMGVWSLL
jgi:hypothetical protein